MDVYRNSQNRSVATPKSVASEQLDLEFDERPYLLVDLRDKDDFRMNHIVSGKTLPSCSINTFFLSVSFIYLAHHYPAAMLSRCSNNESKELLIYVSEEQREETHRVNTTRRDLCATLDED